MTGADQQRRRWRGRALAAGAVLLLLLASLGAWRLRGDAPAEAVLATRTPPGLPAAAHAPEGWTFAVVQPAGAPAQRYGVAAPVGRASRRAVLILPGAGESAEPWFETAHALVEAGAVVWMLERTGQGGSARAIAPADRGHAASFAPDMAVTQALAREAGRQAPLVIVGRGLGARIAAAALPGERLLLLEPSPAPPPASGTDRLLLRVGLGRLRAAAAAVQPPPLLRQAAWARANPPLRIRERSLAWVEAERCLPTQLPAQAVASLPGRPGDAAWIAALASAVEAAAALPPSPTPHNQLP